MKFRSTLAFPALFVACLSALGAPLDDARALVQAGKLDEAIAQLETALRKGGPDKPVVAFELAKAQAAAGKLISAQITIERLLRETPAGSQNQAVALLNAQLKEAGGNLGEALSAYRTIAESTPAVPEKAEALVGAIRVSTLLTNSPMVERSLTDFTEAFPQDSRTREYLVRLYRARSAAGDNKGAAEAAHRYKAAFPTDPAANVMSEFVHLANAGDYKGALPVFEAERKLPSFVLNYSIATNAMEVLRRDPAGFPLIEPLATEYAKLTGDPQLQITAIESLPSANANEAVALAGPLLGKLEGTAWAPRLRLAYLSALRIAKNDPEAEKQAVSLLTTNPANSTAWDHHWAIVSGAKRPEAHEQLLKQALASTASQKNLTIKLAAQSNITYRLAQYYWSLKNTAEAEKYLQDFLLKSGSSADSANATRLIIDLAFAGQAAALKAVDDAEAAYKTARANAKAAGDNKKDSPGEKAVAAAKEALDKAQAALEAVNANTTAKLDLFLPSLEKYLARTMTWGTSLEAVNTAFKPYFANNNRTPGAKKFNEVMSSIRQADLYKQHISNYASAMRDPNQYARAASTAEAMLPKVLEAGGALGLEAGNEIISALYRARLFPKVISASKAYFAKYPGATGPIYLLASSAQQLGAPKNMEAVPIINEAIAAAGNTAGPIENFEGTHRNLFEVYEQNRLPAEMEKEYNLIAALYPGLYNAHDYQRRLGVAYASVGDLEAGKKWLLAAVKSAQPTASEYSALFAIGTSFTNAADWALPLMDAYLARPTRGPQQGAIQILRAHLLQTEKKDTAGALKALQAAAARPSDFLWNIGPLPWQWTDPMMAPITKEKLEEAKPEEIAFLSDVLATVGLQQAHWLPLLMLRQAQSHHPLDFAQSLNRVTAAQNPNDGSALSSAYLTWSQQLVGINQPELAGLVLRNAVNRFTGVDPKLRAQASQALFSMSTKFGFPATEIDDKLEWAPLLKAAISYRMGDPVAAWKAYQENEPLFEKHQDKISADFLRWVSDRLLQREDDPSKEAAERILRRWIIANENSTVVPQDEKAKTQLQLADFYFKTLRYDLSRSECTSLINRFPNTPEATDAQFRIGECYLNQKMYTDAAKIFEQMAKSKDKISASRGEFLLGVLAQQRGDAEDAKSRFRNVMDLAPTSEVANAILYRLSELYGQENRFRDELMLLRSIGLIGSSAKQWHPPGIPLNIVIQDADLGVSRGQSYVPVVVTTTSGDREVVRLESGSAGKGFFRAELQTELGEAKPGDNVLQVNGSDAITYDYPDEFKKQFSAIAPPVSNIRLASDAEFKISATEIKEEEEISFEDRLRQQRQLAGKQAGLEFRQNFRVASDLKPGNNVYLQVKDPDRDVSKEADTVQVLVTAASGSRVSVPLTETGSHTGIFQGTLKTQEISANIFASDRSQNNEAVRAIDSNRKTAWEGLNDGRAPKYIVLDLKESKKIGTFKWANDGFTRDKIPTEYAVQVSPDGGDWKTIAATAKFNGATAEQTALIESKTEKNATEATIKLNGAEGRYVRLFIEKFSGSAPRIGEIAVTDAEGNTVIPARQEEAPVAGDALRLTPSDRISAAYEDEVSMASVGKPRTLNQQLQATYYNGKLDFIAYEFKPVKGQNVPEKFVKQVRRVDPGQRVIVRIQDYDADVSDQRDTVKFILKTPEGKELPMEATETEPFTGVFTKEIDIYSTEHPDGLKLAPGTALTGIYLDEQNTDPGAPIQRTAVLEATPSSDAKVAFVQTTVETNKNGDERFAFAPTFAPDAPPIKPVAFRAPLTFEILDPASAKDSFSEIKATLTTSGGSSVEVICPLSDVVGAPKPLRKGEDEALEIGRFVGQIFMNLGDKDSPPTIVLEPGDTRTLVPRRNPAAIQDQELANVVPVLNLNGQDIITVSYTVNGKEVKDQARLSVPAKVEFTDSGYDKPVSNLYIGDKVYVSVKDLTADATPERDSVQVTLTSPRGENFTLKLDETLGHSGEFTGSFPLVAGEKPTPNDDKMEAWFGDSITLSYASKNTTLAKYEKAIDVVKGTDANLLVFEKKYATEKVAIESQFRMAEAYFELFKNFRALKQTQQATNALNEGMQLLKELAVDYPSKAYEARTDYLLGQFAQELKKYDEAIAYYKRIVANHSDNPIAPDAQYKLGQCFEEKGDMDAASAEYVTLAYTWPDSPLVGNVVVRIAEYFYNKKEYPTAAEVSKKFVERFPTHEWAERMLFRAAQCWFKADKFLDAAREFDLLVENYPRGKFRADAVFWAGESYRSAGQLESAFRRYKRATWDFPESDAAKFARGKLVLPEMVNISDKDAQQ